MDPQNEGPHGERAAGVALVMVLAAALCAGHGRGAVTADAIKLPDPRTTGDVAVEKALAQRRSVREFASSELTLAEISQLLWAAQGITHDGGGRTAPSAGALHPLEIHLVAGRVAGLAPGVYRYLPERHALEPMAEGDRRKALAAAARDQDWLALAPAALVIAGVDQRTAVKYGSRARRYVDFEGGCAAQNMALQAAALGLGTVVVGAFDEAHVQTVAGLSEEERPLCLMPVGRR